MSQLQVTGEAKIRDIQGPVVSNSGVITALDGDASQYVRGDGTLADFPTSTGGGSSVSYYLNSSVSQGTIGGVAYRQLSKTPISGAGTDITASTNGYIASYLTDANDPALLEVPAGNFNCEFYFSVNSNNHNPYVYAELYKYDGTTFTLLGSSQSIPEYLTNGTTLSAYYFAIPVAVAALTITDRLAIRIYANVDTRIVTLHTENNHLCQVVTTFSKGLTSLNNLTRQVQFLATGTSGTDFAISSSVATHTFNLPVASAANTGKLSSSDWSVFNAKQAALSFTAPLVNSSNTISIPVATSSVDGYLDNLDWTNFNTAYNNMIVSAAVTGTTTKTLTLTQQDAGTITASWTDDNTDAVTSVFGRTGAVVAVSGDYNTSQVTESGNLYFTDSRARLALSFAAGSGAYNSTTGVITIPTNNNQITNGSNFITLTSLSSGAGISYNNTTGAISSTITQYTDALARASVSLTTTGTSGAATYNSTTGVFNIPNYTPDLSAYVTLATTQTITGSKTFGNPTFNNGGISLQNGSSYSSTGYMNLGGLTDGLRFTSGGGISNYFNLPSSVGYTYTYPAATGTLALTSQLTGGTVTSVGLSSATSGVTIGSSPITTSGTITLAIATASGSLNGLLSSTDWTTFNSKQNALTNPVTGTGLAGAIPKFTTTGSTIGSSNLINDSSGNLGLGVTPSAWSGFKAFEIGYVGNGLFATGQNDINILSNAYFNSGYKYAGTGKANLLEMYNGEYYFMTAPSGTAGNAISFTQAMTLGSNSGLSIGTTTAAAANGLLVAGAATFSSSVTANGLYANAGNSARFYRGANDAYWSINNDSNNYLNFGSFLANGTAVGTNPKMVLFDSGNVGIGIAATDLGFKLDVNGTGRFSGNLSVYLSTYQQIQTYFSSPYTSGLKFSDLNGQIIFNAGTDNMNIVSNAAGGNITLGTAGTTRLTIASTGAATFSNSVTANTFVEIVGDLRFNSNSADRSIYFRGTAGSPDTNWKMGTYITPTGATVVTSAATVIDVYNGAGYGFMVRNTSNAPLLQIAGNTGAATFSSSVTAQSAYLTGALTVTVPTDNTYRILNIIQSGREEWYLQARNNTSGGYTQYLDWGIVGGANILTMVETGNVGIGTSSPLSKLHVNGTMQVGYVDASNTAMEFYWNGASSYGRIQTYSSSALALNPLGNNVLIGNTSDNGSKLQVNGVTQTNGLALSRTSFSSSTTMTDAFFIWEFGGGIGQTLTLYSSTTTNMHFIKNLSSIPLTITAHSGGAIMGLSSGTPSTSITLGAFKTVQIYASSTYGWYIMYQTT